MAAKLKKVSDTIPHREYIAMEPGSGRVLDQVVTDNYAIYNGDACVVMPALPAESIHFSVYSPPFGGMMYQYSSDPADLSNSKDYEEFFEHYGFIVRDIHRVTMPGRMTAVHCTDLMKNVGGEPALIDFPGDIIDCHQKNGWMYCARIHIWKEPLTVRNRTMVSSLHHATLVEDSTKVSIANADVLLIFRRDGKNTIPVNHPCGIINYAGSREIPLEVMKFKGHKGNQIKNGYSQWIWRQYASSNWDDIRIDRTLGKGAGIYSGNKAEKDESDEKHMHPLQLDVIERAVTLWTNPGETVLTPFLGVGSEVYGAVINGRKGIGIELKAGYFRQAVNNLASTTKTAAALEKPAESNTLDFGDDEESTQEEICSVLENIE